MTKKGKHTWQQEYNGGCPTLEQQAINRHEEAETRINLEMGKLGLDAIKKFKAMFADWNNLKENTKLSLIEKVFKYNKDFLREYRELLVSDQEEEEYEDDDIVLDLSSAPAQDSKSLN